MSLRHGDPNSLIIIDVDHFKKINDTYGHHAGDTVLKEIARLLKSRLRKTDVLCRVGGEEFVALCKRAGRTEAMDLAEKLRRSVENTPFEARGHTINVTVSAGVSTVPDPNNTRTADDFYHCADIALYTSKKSGRNRVSHHDGKLD
jgi:diguanylate cyclase (GGDEF)-like protein